MRSPFLGLPVPGTNEHTARADALSRFEVVPSIADNERPIERDIEIGRGLPEEPGLRFAAVTRLSILLDDRVGMVWPLLAAPSVFFRLLGSLVGFDRGRCRGQADRNTANRLRGRAWNCLRRADCPRCTGSDRGVRRQPVHRRRRLTPPLRAQHPSAHCCPRTALSSKSSTNTSISR